MSYMPVVAGILVQDGRFLASRRPEHTRFGGMWEFPGGKVEQGETLEQALERELDEELGIVPVRFKLWQEVRTVCVDRISYANTTFCLRPLSEQAAAWNRLHIWLYFFIITSFEGIPQPCEGQTLTWLSSHEAEKKSFVPADVEIVQRLGRLLER